MPADVDPAVAAAEPAAGRSAGVLESSPFPILLVSLVGIVLLTVFGPALVVGDTWLTLMAGREVVENGLPRDGDAHRARLGRDVDRPAVARAGRLLRRPRARRACAPSSCSTSCSSSLALGLDGGRRPGGRARRPARRSSSACSPCSPARGAGRSAPRPRRCRSSPACSGCSLDAARRGVRRRTLLVLPALVLWANLHGSVVLGATPDDAPRRLRARARAPARRGSPSRSLVLAPALRPRDAVRLGHRRVLRPDARRRAVRGDPARVAVVEPERDDLPLLRARARRRRPRRARPLPPPAERLRAARARRDARRRRAGGARRDLVRARRRGDPPDRARRPLHAGGRGRADASIASSRSSRSPASRSRSS